MDNQSKEQRSDELIKRLQFYVDERVKAAFRKVGSVDGIRGDAIIGNISYTTIQNALGEIKFEDLGNVPSLEADKWVAINSAGNGVVFLDPPSGTGGDLAFEDLTNVPNPLVANKLFKVKSDASGLEFYDIPVIPSTIQDLSNVPNTLVANKLLKVNSAANAIEFIDYPTLPTVPVNIEDLENVPELVAGKILRVNDTASAIEYIDDPTPAPGAEIIPGRYVMTEVGGSTTSYQLLPDFKDHPDTPPSSAGIYDDEFNGASVSSAWKWVNPNVADTVTLVKRRLVFNHKSNLTSCLVKTVSGSFTVTTPIHLYCLPIVNYEQGGMVVGRGTLASDVYSGTKGYTFNYTPQSSAIEIYRINNLLYDADIVAFGNTASRGMMYHRISYNATTEELKFYISYEGIFFHHLHTRTGVISYLGGAPNFVGYMLVGALTNDTGQTIVSPWFRSS